MLAMVQSRDLVRMDESENNSLISKESVTRIDNSLQRRTASVKITEYPSSQANPEPFVDEQDETFEDFISAQSLKKFTGTSNLTEVTTLELKVDSSETSISNIGFLLPNLIRLKLNNSIITSIRDLGTGLINLQALWMARCGLFDLDGISCFSSLKELYLSYNEIDDLSGVSMIEHLEILDLEGNNIDDIAQVEFLSLCSKLRILTLEGNPVELAPHPETKQQDLKFYDYRHALYKAIPILHVLDDEPFLFDIVNRERVLKSTQKSPKKEGDESLKDDLLLIQESIKAIDFLEDETSDGESVTSGALSRLSSYRPSSGSSGGRRSVSARNRPISSRQRPTTGTAAVSSRQEEANLLLEHDESSDLTHGSNQVLCGNPVRALLARRKERRKQINLRLGVNRVKKTSRRFTPEHSYLDDEEDTDTNKDQVFEELLKWRQEFARNNNTINPSGDLNESFPPTPPNAPRQRHRGAIRRSPQSPLSVKDSESSRPHTASDFRSRRFRSKSTTVHEMSKSVTDENYTYGHVDDSTIASKDVNINSRGSPRSGSRYHWKSKSVGNRMFSPGIDEPLPENPLILLQRNHNNNNNNNIRPGTAKAALQRAANKHFS